MTDQVEAVNPATASMATCTNTERPKEEGRGGTHRHKDCWEVELIRLCDLNLHNGYICLLNKYLFQNEIIMLNICY